MGWSIGNHCPTVCIAASSQHLCKQQNTVGDPHIRAFGHSGTQAFGHSGIRAFEHSAGACGRGAEPLPARKLKRRYTSCKRAELLGKTTNIISISPLCSGMFSGRINHCQIFSRCLGTHARECTFCQKKLLYGGFLQGGEVSSTSQKKSMAKLSHIISLEPNREDVKASSKDQKLQLPMIGLPRKLSRLMAFGSIFPTHRAVGAVRD